MRVRRLMARAYDDFLKPFDAVATPTRATVASPLDKAFREAYPDVKGGVSLIGSSNVVGVPGISVLNGFGLNGLPTGLSFVTRAFDELKLVRLARLYQSRTDWHAQRPRCPKPCASLGHPSSVPSPGPLVTEVVRRAQQGDQSAFHELYREHVGRMYALCLRLTGSAAEAEERTQDVFVQAWRKLASFRGESAFSSWLHRLAVNLVLMERRAGGGGRGGGGAGGGAGGPGGGGGGRPPARGGGPGRGAGGPPPR